MKKIIFVILVSFITSSISLNSIEAQPTCWVSNLADDLAAAENGGQHSVFKNFYENADEITRVQLIEGYIKLAAKPQVRIDVATCLEMGKILTDPATMNRLADHLGSEAQIRFWLDEVVNAMINKCPTCTNGSNLYIKSDKYLSNLKFAIDTYHDVDNFSVVLNTLKNTAPPMQDGMSHFLAAVRKFDGSSGPPSGGRTITEFEGTLAESIADAVGNTNVCQGCMFDIKLSDGTHIELKSYIATTVANINSTPTTLAQFKTYFQLDLGKFEYWFNGLKIDDIGVIKMGFKEVFEVNGFYQSVVNPNTNLNNFLLSIGVDSEIKFLKAVNEDAPYGDALYKFIKIIQ